MENLVDLKYDIVFEELFRIDEEVIWLNHGIKPQMLSKSSMLKSVKLFVMIRTNNI